MEVRPQLCRSWSLHFFGVLAYTLAWGNEVGRHSFIAGQFHPLGIVALQGLSDDLYRSGRVRVRPRNWRCGETGSSLMHSAVQPPCVGNVCAGPLSRSGDMATWEAVRIVRVGIYQLCWCRPSYACQDARSCCLEDASFNEEVGEVEAAGPAWVSVSPVLGQGFRFELQGPEVLQGTQALLRLRSMGSCGFVPFRSEEELGAFTLMEAGPEHEILIMGTPPDAAADLNISGEIGSRVLVAYLYRHLAYSICWCARNCFKDGVSEVDEEAFSAEIGEFFPRGPETENVPPQKVVAGVSFALTVQGDRLSMKDRILVPESSTSCGDVATAHALAFRSHVCERGEGSCISTPANGPPTSYQNLGDLVGEAGISFVQEAWSPIQIDTPGSYRICWCVDDSWDPIKLESHGLCGSGFQFSVQAGLILVQGAHPEQAFQCGSFQPCQLHVISDLPFESEDRVMIVAPPPTSTNSLATVCGRGTSGLQVQLTSSMSIWDTTSTSPAIFTTTLAPNETTTTLEPRPSHYVGEFHLESAGQAGLYRICYCKHSVLGPCDDPVAFAQWAGVLNISGRVQYEERIAIHQQCLASARCYFNITGVWAMQLSFSDSFRAVPLDVACDTEADSSSYPKFSLLRRLQLSDTWRAEFTHQAGAEDFYFTGDYKLCYCQASQTATGRCAPEEHTQEMGTLYLLGAKSTVDSWTCRQGATCELLVHGWRMDLNDAVRLVSPSFVCGEKDPHEVFLGAGFDENPSLANRTANTSDGVLLHFDLGRARGSGRWKVCLCVAAVAKSRRNCSEASDYGQQVGELLIEGLLRSVTPSSQPSTMQMASVLVDVIEPGSAMSVACAASNQSLDQAPSSMAVRTCKDSIPGCLGLTTLPWRAEQGYNILHIPLLYNGPAAEAHVWCTGDVALCMTGRCVLPPTPNGLRLSLNPGPDPWTELHAAIGEDLELQVNGNPLNTQGGWLKVVWPWDGCPEVDQPWEILSPLDFGRPTSSAPERWMRWKMAQAPLAGRFWLCWCDRSYGASCALWQHIGALVLAGPENVTALPQTVELREEINVTLNGVNLTWEERLFIDSSACQGEGAELISPSTVEASRAIFHLTAPPVAGAFVVCWTRENTTLLPKKLGDGFARESRDCVLAGWELATPTWEYPHLTSQGAACSRACGGGVYQMHRAILAEALGAGRRCPPPKDPERLRFQSCHTQSCPQAMTLNAYTLPFWVRPNEAFQVMVEGYFLDPQEDRVVLVGESARCGEAANASRGAAENGTDSDGSEQSDRVNGWETVLQGAGGSCARPASNSTFLECGDGDLSLVASQPGRYRLCVCHAASVEPGYINISGSMVLARERCSRLEDYSLTPSNGSLVDVTDVAIEDEEPKDTSDVLGILGMKGLIEPGQERSDLLLVLGLLGATALYCCAIFCACWFWRYRWRKRGEWRRLGSGLFKNSLVAKATKAAWEAYSRAVTEQDDSGPPEEPQLESVAPGEHPPQGTLTPPGTAMSMKSGSSAFSSSTSSTRATTPGNHPSLLKVSLNRDVHRPVSPKMGGSFLDLPLAGKGTRSAGNSPSRPGTAQTVVTIQEEPSSEGLQQETPKPEAGDATPKEAASRLLEMQLPGLERKLAKLKEEQSESAESSPREAPKSALPKSAPKMAPPNLPGQLASEAKAAAVTRDEVSPRPSEVPHAPTRSPVPSLSMRPPLPPPGTKKAQAEQAEAPTAVPAAAPATPAPAAPQPPTPVASAVRQALDEVEDQESELQDMTPTSAAAPVLPKEEGERPKAPDMPSAPSAPVSKAPVELPSAPSTPKVDASAPSTPQAPELSSVPSTPMSKAPAEMPSIPSTPKAEMPTLEVPSAPSTPMSKEMSLEAKDPASTPSTPKEESPTASASAPKLSSWLTDMRSRMAGQAATPAATGATPAASKLAPSSSLRSHRSTLPPKPPPKPAKDKELSTATMSSTATASVPSLPLATLQEEPSPSLVRCFPGSEQQGATSKSSAESLLPGEAPEPEPADAVSAPSRAAEVPMEAVSSESSQNASLPPGFQPRNVQLPTGNWDDSQEKLRQEWHQRLAANVDEHDAPKRGKASLRGSAGSLRRPGASLRNAASASGSAANSQVGSLAPSRASQSPVMSPRRTDEEEPRLPPPPPPRPAKGPGAVARGPGPPLPGAPAGPGGGKLAPNWAF